MIRIRHLCALAALFTCLPSVWAEDTLVDATLLISSGTNHAAGLDRPAGDAMIVLKAADAQAKLANVTFQPTDPAAAYKFSYRALYCDQGNRDAFQIWGYQTTPPHPNINIEALFKGQITSCQSRGGGATASFEASIVHLDLDVDSDNTADVLAVQKSPKTQVMPYKLGQNAEADIQETKEDPQGSDDQTNPGLLLVVNHGFEQITYNRASPIEDWQRPEPTSSLPVQTDLDLVKARIQITSTKAGYLTLDYPSAKLRIYRIEGSAARYIEPGTERPAQPGEIALLLEGVDPGGVDGSCRITASFRPEGSQSGNSPAKDIVKVTVIDPVLAVDRDRDLTIRLGGKDVTTRNLPFAFWYNNDHDTEYEDETVSSDLDYEGDAISDIRDLEDMPPMVVQIKGLNSYVRNGSYRVGLRWMPGAVGDPAVKLFWNKDDLLATTHYMQEVASARTLQRRAVYIGESVAEATAWIPQNRLIDFESALRHSAIWHCNRATERPVGFGSPLKDWSTGRLGVVVSKSGASTPLAVNPHHWFEFGDIRRMYTHLTAGDVLTEPNVFPVPALTQVADTVSVVGAGGRDGVYDPEADEHVKKKGKLLCFVHGYRMRPLERRKFAETLFKRLYWQQYGGRMAFFSWPTEYVEGVGGQLGEPQNYDRSEFQARRTGATILNSFLSQIRIRYSVPQGDMILCGHSKGNIVISEGLRLNGEVTPGKYIAMQSAEASGMYKWNPAGKRGVSPRQPDIGTFAAPRQPRSLLTWREYTGRPNGRGQATEQLTPMLDGEPYYARIRQRTGMTSVSYFNEDDFVNTTVWRANQKFKPDVGFEYMNILGNPEDRDDPRNPPIYHDEYNRDRYTDVIPGPGMIWDAYAPERFIERCAILAFVSEASSLTVGSQSDMATASTTDYWARPLPANAVGRESIFRSVSNLNEVNIAGNNDYDHSAQFNWNIQRMWQFYGRFLGDL